MKNSQTYLISSKQKALNALVMLDSIPGVKTLFVLDEEEKLVGSLTDGDIRRGLIKLKSLEKDVDAFMNKRCLYLIKGRYSIDDLANLRKSKTQLVPILDENMRVLEIINFANKRSILPVDVFIVAGGEGKRLRPWTIDVPKPLLKIGDLPIIEHNLIMLNNFGINNVHISIKYLGEQIKNHLKDGSHLGINIEYVEETVPMGTIGSLSLLTNIHNDYVLLMNSDILSNIDLEDFFKDFINKNADFSVASVPYKINVPYGVLEIENETVSKFREKPTFTYNSNAGIYLIKKDVLHLLRKDTFYNATDFLEDLINMGKKVISYPIVGYWVDIGTPEDLTKAREDFKHLAFND